MRVIALSWLCITFELSELSHGLAAVAEDPGMLHMVFANAGYDILNDAFECQRSP